MNQKIKILILGAGPAQIDAIRYCKHKGYYVHVCSNKIPFSVLKFADKIQVIDIKDVDGIEKYALENKIDLIYSVGSSLAVITASIVSKRLNLKSFVEPETLLTCHNKLFMRQRLGSSHPANIRFKALNKIEDTEDWDIFPAVIKPVDNQGQRGVYLIKNKEDFKNYFDISMEFSYQKQLSITEFIDGPEISVNLYMKNGKIVFHQISKRIALENYPGWKPQKHIINGFIPVNETKLIETLADILNIFSIREGPVYFQIRCLNGVPKLIEFMPRLDGCHLWRLIEMATGVNLLEYTFDDLITGDLQLHNKVKKDNYFAINFIYDSPHQKFNSLKYSDIKSDCYEWYYKDGEIIEQTNGSSEKIGYYITNYK